MLHPPDPWLDLKTSYYFTMVFMMSRSRIIGITFI